MIGASGSRSVLLEMVSQGSHLRQRNPPGFWPAPAPRSVVIGCQRWSATDGPETARALRLDSVAGVLCCSAEILEELGHVVVGDGAREVQRRAAVSVRPVRVGSVCPKQRDHIAASLAVEYSGPQRRVAVPVLLVHGGPVGSSILIASMPDSCAARCSGVNPRSSWGEGWAPRAARSRRRRSPRRRDAEASCLEDPDRRWAWRHGP